ncbi:MAG: hypothetical protein M1114_01800 [Candidatus Dependentiae bacterium]|nr:hypothetical protein [Candidatus Dependentiae bacterium]
MKHWQLILSIVSLWSLSAFGCEHFYPDSAQETVIKRSLPIDIHSSRKRCFYSKNPNVRIDYLNPEFDSYEPTGYPVALLAFPYEQVIYFSCSRFSETFTDSLTPPEDKKSDDEIYESELLD